MKEGIIGGMSDGSLRVGGEPHPIVLRKPSLLPQPGYEIREFDFTDGLKELASGCELTISPDVGTRTVYHQEDVTNIIDELKAGSGTFLALTPQGEIKKYYVGSYSSKTAVEYGKGWLVTWIAGPKGARILQIGRPLLQRGIAVQSDQAEIDGLRIPERYWRERNKLLIQAATRAVSALCPRDERGY